jgi:hypothetical protein
MVLCSYRSFGRTAMWTAKDFWVSGFRIHRTCILYATFNGQTLLFNKFFLKVNGKEITIWILNPAQDMQ